MNCSPASIDALEDALARVVAAENPSLGTLARLTTAVRVTRPSEKLFPAIALLLKGKKSYEVLPGIDAAASLGREEMVPLLQPLLDSMDAGIRKRAKDAIDSIVETRKLKDAPPQTPPK